jgi:hypothetical protein
MIYTSYYAKWDKIPGDLYKVGITIFPPKWLPGITNLWNLAPNKELLDYMKKCNGDEATYTIKYTQLLESRFVRLEKVGGFLTKFMAHVNAKDLVMCCYEKPGEFCHRHLLAEILNNTGFKTEEYEYIY